MKDLDSHFETVHMVAASELGDSIGCQLLCEHLRSPFDSVDALQVKGWVANLGRILLKKCWGSREFKSSIKTHGKHLLYVAETGDVPQIVSIGYPMMENAHTFQNIEELTNILLPQLKENISCVATNDKTYFECVDLFHC